MLFFCLSVGPFCDIMMKRNDYGRDYHMILENLNISYLFKKKRGALLLSVSNLLLSHVITSDVNKVQQCSY